MIGIDVTGVGVKNLPVDRDRLGQLPALVKPRPCLKQGLKIAGRPPGAALAAAWAAGAPGADIPGRLFRLFLLTASFRPVHDRVPRNGEWKKSEVLRV